LFKRRQKHSRDGPAEPFRWQQRPRHSVRRFLTPAEAQPLSSLTTNRAHVHYSIVRVVVRVALFKRHTSCDAQSYKASKPPVCCFATTVLGFEKPSVQRLPSYLSRSCFIKQLLRADLRRMDALFSVRQPWIDSGACLARSASSRTFSNDGHTKPSGPARAIPLATAIISRCLKPHSPAKAKLRPG
jgi:hypothetical protein